MQLGGAAVENAIPAVAKKPVPGGLSDVSRFRGDFVV
jgi:hypothetical protein